ncbi:EF-hand [Aphelenchoides avenae]|nr:EF-hand [Aphelenchus avenae]
MSTTDVACMVPDRREMRGTGPHGTGTPDEEGRFEDHDGHIDFRNYARVLACFRPISKTKPNEVNSRVEKLRFAFLMYDLNKSGYISRDEFQGILIEMVGSNITNDQLQFLADRTISEALDQIADRTIMEADANGDGMISFEEFCRAMERTDIEGKMSIRFSS